MEDIGQLLLSFLLARSRLEWYRGLPEVFPADNPRITKKPGRTSVSELPKSFQLKLGADYEGWEIACDCN
jgi:hypothetical protein